MLLKVPDLLFRRHCSFFPCFRPECRKRPDRRLEEPVRECAELERYIGKHANSKENAANISAAVKECLLVNPYIQSVNRIEITEREKDRLTLTVYLTSVYGELVEEVSV